MSDHLVDSRFIDRLRHKLNTDVVERLLIKYFMSKGYDNFDRLIYPPFVQDIPFMVQELADKIEIVPHAVRIDPLADTAVIGWNLFVLGTYRCFLGETQHQGLRQLALQLTQGMVASQDQSATRQTTPRRVIKFITDVLAKHQSGYVNLTPRVVPMPLQRQAYRPRTAGSSAGSFFVRSGGGG